MLEFRFDPRSVFVHQRFAQVSAVLAACAAAATVQTVAGQLANFDDPQVAGVGESSDAAELVPSAAAALPPILPGQEPGAREKPKAVPAPTSGVAREWFGHAPCCGWTHATGDWNEARTALSDAGFALNGSYIGEWADVVRGGISDKSAYRFLLDLNLTIDLDVIAKVKGGSVFVDFQTAGTPVGDLYTGAFQAYSNIAITGSITQISQAYYQQWLLDDTLRLKIGKVDANTEFAFIPAAAGFINASSGYTPTILPFPTYPNPASSATAFVYPNEHFYVGAGIYHGLSEATDDWFTIAEAGLNLDTIGPLDQARIAVGGWWHSGDFARFDGGTDEGTGGFYALAQARAWHPACDDEAEEAAGEACDEDESCGLWFFLQYGSADPAVSAAAQQFGFGSSLKGTFGDRCNDSLGVYFSLIDFSSEPAAGFTSNELAIELYYDFAVTPSFHVKPDLQWFGNPGGVDADNAVVAAVRCTITF